MDKTTPGIGQNITRDWTKQHQGLDKTTPGVGQNNTRNWTKQHQGLDKTTPECNEEQGEMEETSFKIICDAPLTLKVIGLKMMMMMVMNDEVYITETRY